MGTTGGLLFAILPLLTCLLIHATDSFDHHQETESLQCSRNREQGTVQCTFSIGLEQLDHPQRAIQLQSCPSDGSICIQTQVSVTTVAPDRRTDESLLHHNPTSMTTSDSTGITIGRIRYNKPVSQYSSNIAKLLRMFDPLETTARSVMDEAHWLVALGSAHREDLQVYVDECDEIQRTTGHAAEYDMDRVHRLADQSSNALELASLLYRRMLQSPHSTHQEARIEPSQLVYSSSLAHAYFHMSDLWSAVAFFDASHHQAAKEYMEKASELFRFCKDANVHELADSSGSGGHGETADNKYTEVEHVDDSYYWGLSLLRLGMMQMSITQSLQWKQEQETVGELLIDPTNLQDLAAEQERMDQLAAGLQNVADSVQKSVHYLEQAANFFSRQLEPMETDQHSHPADTALYQLNLASALQHLGENEVALNKLESASRHGERALEIYKNLIRFPQHFQQADIFEIHHNVGDLTLGLSRTFLQLADYDKASLYYHQAMEWYQMQGINPTNLTPLPYKHAGIDGTIDEYEELLEDYRAIKNGESYMDMPEEILGEDGVTFVANDAYASSLHSTLGYLYMSTGDIYQATSHMRQALFLHRQSTEEPDEVLGDILYNMAILTFSNGDFIESASFFDESVEVFRKVFANGENPLFGTFGPLDPSVSLSQVNAESGWTDNSKPDQPGPASKAHESDRGSETQSKKGQEEAKQVPEHLQLDRKHVARKSRQPKLQLNLDDFQNNLLNETREEL